MAQRNLGRLLEPLGAIVVGVAGGYYIFSGPIKEAVDKAIAQEKQRQKDTLAVPSAASTPTAQGKSSSEKELK